MNGRRSQYCSARQYDDTLRIICVVASGHRWVRIERPYGAHDPELQKHQRKAPAAAAAYLSMGKGRKKAVVTRTGKNFSDANLLRTKTLDDQEPCMCSRESFELGAFGCS